jgi:hypothetical protein
MPYIKLKKEYSRSAGDSTKLFPEGSEIFVSWDHYKQLIQNDFCDEIKIEKQKEVKLKKDKKTTIKKK